MQKIENEADLMRAAESVQKKSETFFGSARLFIEKYIEEPRHIEAQIIGDNYGTIRSIGTRDCSIQRRHQKVIEEAPAPNFSKEADNALQEGAVKAASALAYTNAGTVEFLVDKDENVYFLEMNTRLQVEHPVTEETSGTDLVEWQLLIADGKSFEELPVNNTPYPCAMEVRVYAEDPKTFFPSPGTITQWNFPTPEKVRFDMGVRKGDKVTPYYDPMIGKIIASGDSREDVINNLINVLEGSEISGIKTNIPLLLDVLKDDKFKSGKISTHFLMQTN
ncbi:Biotin carboxylase C-terminal domain-containing protein [Alkalicoccus daliensis]|uniref:Biotin carboxylase C-terminal domain-containing protein n=1 Tax=Alkalicoccus daliensis TaxID=745820 RepID=A0A1H0IDE8_9BACI|nr:Biotin carboxylase C-terminal domain-containing protein [Alkalicoccus daliensis]